MPLNAEVLRLNTTHEKRGRESLVPADAETFEAFERCNSLCGRPVKSLEPRKKWGRGIGYLVARSSIVFASWGRTHTTVSTSVQSAVISRHELIATVTGSGE